MTDCIDNLRQLAKLSRSSVEKALAVLRRIGLLAVDGYGLKNEEHPEWRKVVFYRLAGTPEHALPGPVHCGREGHDDTSGRWVPGDDATACLTCGFTYMPKTNPRVVKQAPHHTSTSGGSPTSSSRKTIPGDPFAMRGEAEYREQEKALRRNHSTHARCVADPVVASSPKPWLEPEPPPRRRPTIVITGWGISNEERLRGFED